jgi:hypothetical protein
VLRAQPHSSCNHAESRSHLAANLIDGTCHLGSATKRRELNTLFLVRGADCFRPAGAAFGGLRPTGDVAVTFVAFNATDLADNAIRAGREDVESWGCAILRSLAFSYRQSDTHLALGARSLGSTARRRDTSCLAGASVLIAPAAGWRQIHWLR